MSGLAAELRARIGTLALDVALEVAEGETVALLGPNGAGKTSILRTLAGLLPVDDGFVSVDDELWDGPGQASVPPERRSVGFVFQDYLLFPHLRAVDNVAFGLRQRGHRRGEARALAHTWVDRIGLSGLDDRRPAQLSGGQQQRVALARALAPGPRLLLLDEPLAALDVATRRDVRRDLRTHLGEFPGMAVVVTHDPVDALVLADRIVIIEDGVAVQSGTSLEVTSRPRSSFAADVAGLNLFRGRSERGVVRVSERMTLVTNGGVDGDVFAVVHPHAIALHAARPEGSARNVWVAAIEEVDVRAGAARVQLRIEGQPLVAEITADSYRALGLTPGRETWASLKATEIDVFPA